MEEMMRIDIPVHGHVVCIDGDAGTSIALIVDPVQRRLTHVVVRERGVADSERLVPTDLVEGSSENAISLSCTKDQLHELDDFIEAHFVDLTYANPSLAGPLSEQQLSPLVISKRIPAGKVALGRWAVVETTDGSVGHVQSVVVDSANYRIMHVVVRTHRFLSRQEVAVPVTEVERVLGNYVLLRVSRGDVERLPHVALHEAYLLPPLEDHDRRPVEKRAAERRQEQNFQKPADRS
jgi:sporulation protein YlmC with PRC-barrel domain